MASRQSQPTSIWAKVRYYCPVLGWLPSYNLNILLRHDLPAGLTTATIIIPQALAYAQELVHLPPVYGLYACSMPLLIYSILGTSRQLAIGPEALVSILTGASIKAYQKTNPLADSIAIATLMALLVGIFTFILGFFRLGFLDSVLSRALLRGFITAVAGVVVIDMLPTLFGIPLIGDESGKSPIDVFLEVLWNIDATHLLTLCISIASITFCLSIRYIKRRNPSLYYIPEVLILVITSTMLSFIFSWSMHGVNVLRDVQGGLILPRIPQEISFDRVNSLFLSSVLISVIGFVESSVVAKTYASQHNYAISPNRELVALGIGNIISCFFGAWPSFGSLGRSAVNNTSGAKTQMAGFITGIFVLIATCVLLPLFYHLPRAVCSSIIVVAALGLIEMHDIAFMLKLGAWNDLCLLMLTFFATIFISIEAGTLISVGVSLLLVIKHTTKTRIEILGRYQHYTKNKYKSITHQQVTRIPGCMLVRIQEGLFFGNTSMLKDRLKRVELFGELSIHPGIAFEESNPQQSDQSGSPLSPRNGVEPLECVIFEVGAMVGIDASAVFILRDICQDYTSRGVSIAFVKLREECVESFERAGLFDLVGRERFFAKIRTAMYFFRLEDLEESSDLIIFDTVDHPSVQSIDESVTESES